MSDARWGAMRLGIGLQRLMRGSPVLAVFTCSMPTQRTNLRTMKPACVLTVIRGLT